MTPEPFENDRRVIRLFDNSRTLAWIEHVVDAVTRAGRRSIAVAVAARVALAVRQHAGATLVATATTHLALTPLGSGADGWQRLILPVIALAAGGAMLLVDRRRPTGSR